MNPIQAWLGGFGVQRVPVLSQRYSFGARHISYVFTGIVLTDSIGTPYPPGGSFTVTHTPLGADVDLLYADRDFPVESIEPVRVPFVGLALKIHSIALGTIVDATVTDVSTAYEIGSTYTAISGDSGSLVTDDAGMFVGLVSGVSFISVVNPASLPGMSATVLGVPGSYVLQNPLVTPATSPGGYILVTAPVSPTTQLGTFPVLWQSQIGGGYRSVGSLAERNAISTGYRIEGMRVWVKEVGLEYQLAENLTTWNIVPNSGATSGLDGQILMSHGDGTSLYETIDYRGSAGSNTSFVWTVIARPVYTAVGAPPDGTILYFKPDTNSGGGDTLKLGSAATAIPIVGKDGVAISAGAFKANITVILSYCSTLSSWVLLT